MTRAVLCADIGTTSLKAALIDKSGSVIAYSRVRFENMKGISSTTKEPLLFCGDLWLNAFFHAARNLAVEAPDVYTEAICISGNGPTLATDNGEVLLWNAVTQTQAGKDILQQLKPTAAAKSLFIPRLLLFKEIFPQIFENAGIILSGPEYLIWRLTGTATTILPEKRYIPSYWTDNILATVGINPDTIPPFVSPSTNAGGLNVEAANSSGLPTGTPVFCGAPDFIVALVGTNTLTPGTICDRAGSSEGLNLCIDEDPKRLVEKGRIDGIRILPSIIPNLHNASFLISNSGSRFSELKRSVAPNMSYDKFVAALLQDPPLNIKGRTIMDECASLVGEGFKKLAELSLLAGMPSPVRMRTTGGQAKNIRWLQHKADTTGIQIETTACSDAELVGDAVLAFHGLGQFSTIQQGADALVKTMQVFYPGGRL